TNTITTWLFVVRICLANSRPLISPGIWISRKSISTNSPSFIAAWRFSLDEKVRKTRASVRHDALAHVIIASATALQETCSSSHTTTFTDLQLLYGDITILILQA